MNIEETVNDYVPMCLVVRPVEQKQRANKQAHELHRMLKGNFPWLGNYQDRITIKLSRDTKLIGLKSKGLKRQHTFSVHRYTPT